MKIISIKGPVHYAAAIERQIYVAGTLVYWRDHFNHIWTSIGQYHYIVATQLNEEIVIQHYKNTRKK